MSHLTLTSVDPRRAAAARGVALVVEDDEVLRELLVDILASDGWSAVGVGDLPSARAALPRLRADLLVVDYQLGADTSRGLLSELAVAGGASPATLLVSATSEARAVAEGLGVSFLQKPFDIDELLSLAHARVSEARARAVQRSGLRPRTR